MGPFLLFALFAYTLGSIPVNLVLARWFQGRRLVFAAFVVDIAKGFLPVQLGSSFDFSLETQALFGLFALLGHCFPVWAKFYGGKGVAVGYGVFLALSPWLAFLGLLGFVLSRLLVKDSGLAFILAFLLMLSLGFFYLVGSALHLVLSLVVLIVVLRHQDSLRRLFRSQGD